MGYVTANHFRLGLAAQRQQQKAKEQRTERVPSRLMYAIRRDLDREKREEQPNANKTKP